MASGGVFNVSFGGHWLAYCIYTNNYFFIFFRSRWTDLHFHLPIGRKQDYLAQGTMKGITLQISFFSFLFSSSGGFSVWNRGMVTRVRQSSPFCSCLHRRPFFFKGKWSWYVCREIACFQRAAHTPPPLLGSTGFMYSVRKGTQLNLPGQCGNSQPCVQRKEQLI